MLKHGANIEAKNHLDQTPLHYAGIRKNFHLAELLIENNANVNAQDNDVKTAFHYFINSQNQDRQIYLELYGESNLNNNFPDHDSSEFEFIDILNLFIKSNFNFNIKDSYSNPFLHFLITENIQNLDTKIFSIILPHIKDINSKNYNGETILHQIARYNFIDKKMIDLTKFLIENGLDLNTQDKYGNTALLNIIRISNSYMPFQKELVKSLLENKADPNIQNNAGQAPLHFASISKDLSYIENLLENGAEVNITDKSGRTPIIEVSERPFSKEIIQILLDKGATYDNLNFISFNNTYIANTNLIIIITDILKRFNNKVIPLELFISIFRKVIVGYEESREVKELNKLLDELIERGLDINMIFSYHCPLLTHGTAIHYALNRPRGILTELLNKLIELEANVNIIDSNGKRPIDYISLTELSKDPEKQKIPKKLLETGAKLNNSQIREIRNIPELYEIYQDQLEIVKIATETASIRKACKDITIVTTIPKEIWRDKIIPYIIGSGITNNICNLLKFSKIPKPNSRESFVQFINDQRNNIAQNNSGLTK